MGKPNVELHLSQMPVKENSEFLFIMGSKFQGERFWFNSYLFFQFDSQMEPEVIEAEMVLPTYLRFKKVQMHEKYPKGQARGRHWKHLKQIIQAENYQNYPPDEPNCEFLSTLHYICFSSWKNGMSMHCPFHDMVVSFHMHSTRGLSFPYC